MSQKEFKTMLMQNFGGQTKCIMGRVRTESGNLEKVWKIEIKSGKNGEKSDICSHSITDKQLITE